MTLIDESWYQRPKGTPERIASGGVVVRVSGGETFVAFTREGDMREFVLPKGGVELGEDYLKFSILSRRSRWSCWPHRSCRSFGRR